MYANVENHQLKQTSIENKHLKEKVVDLEDQIQILLDEIKVLRESESSPSANSKEVDKTYHEANFNDKISEMFETKIEKLESLNDRLSDSLHDCINKNNDLRDRCSSLENQVHVLSADASLNGQKYSDLHQDYASLQKKYSEHIQQTELHRSEGDTQFIHKWWSYVWFELRKHSQQQQQQQNDGESYHELYHLDPHVTEQNIVQETILLRQELLGMKLREREETRRLRDKVYQAESTIIQLQHDLKLDQDKDLKIAEMAMTIRTYAARSDMNLQYARCRDELQLEKCNSHHLRVENEKLSSLLQLDHSKLETLRADYNALQKSMDTYDLLKTFAHLPAVSPLQALEYMSGVVVHLHEDKQQLEQNLRETLHKLEVSQHQQATTTNMVLAEPMRKSSSNDKMRASFTFSQDIMRKSMPLDTRSMTYTASDTLHALKMLEADVIMLKKEVSSKSIQIVELQQEVHDLTLKNTEITVKETTISIKHQQQVEELDKRYKVEMYQKEVIIENMKDTLDRLTQEVTRKTKELSLHSTHIAVDMLSQSNADNSIRNNDQTTKLHGEHRRAIQELQESKAIIQEKNFQLQILNDTMQTFQFANIHLSTYESYMHPHTSTVKNIQQEQYMTNNVSSGTIPSSNKAQIKTGKEGRMGPSVSSSTVSPTKLSSTDRIVTGVSPPRDLNETSWAIEALIKRVIQLTSDLLTKSNEANRYLCQLHAKEGDNINTESQLRELELFIKRTTEEKIHLNDQLKVLQSEYQEHYLRTEEDKKVSQQRQGESLRIIQSLETQLTQKDKEITILSTQLEKSHSVDDEIREWVSERINSLPLPSSYTEVSSKASVDDFTKMGTQSLRNNAVMKSFASSNGYIGRKHTLSRDMERVDQNDMELFDRYLEKEREVSTLLLENKSYESITQVYSDALSRAIQEIMKYKQRVDILETMDTSEDDIRKVEYRHAMTSLKRLLDEEKYQSKVLSFELNKSKRSSHSLKLQNELYKAKLSKYELQKFDDHVDEHENVSSISYCDNLEENMKSWLTKELPRLLTGLPVEENTYGTLTTRDLLGPKSADSIINPSYALSEALAVAQTNVAVLEGKLNEMTINCTNYKGKYMKLHRQLEAWQEDSDKTIKRVNADLELSVPYAVSVGDKDLESKRTDQSMHADENQMTHLSSKAFQLEELNQVLTSKLGHNETKMALYQSLYVDAVKDLKNNREAHSKALTLMRMKLESQHLLELSKLREAYEMDHLALTEELNEVHSVSLRDEHLLEANGNLHTRDDDFLRRRDWISTQNEQRLSTTSFNTLPPRPPPPPPQSYENTFHPNTSFNVSFIEPNLSENDPMIPAAQSSNTYTNTIKKKMKGKDSRVKKKSNPPTQTSTTRPSLKSAGVKSIITPNSIRSVTQKPKNTLVTPVTKEIVNASKTLADTGIKPGRHVTESSVRSSKSVQESNPATSPSSEPAYNDEDLHFYMTTTNSMLRELKHLMITARNSSYDATGPDEYLEVAAGMSHRLETLFKDITRLIKQKTQSSNYIKLIEPLRTNHKLQREYKLLEDRFMELESKYTHDKHDWNQQREEYIGMIEEYKSKMRDLQDRHGHHVDEVKRAHDISVKQLQDTINGFKISAAAQRDNISPSENIQPSAMTSFYKQVQGHGMKGHENRHVSRSPDKDSTVVNTEEEIEKLQLQLQQNEDIYRRELVAYQENYQRLKHSYEVIVSDLEQEVEQLRSELYKIKPFSSPTKGVNTDQSTADETVIEHYQKEILYLRDTLAMKTKTLDDLTRSLQLPVSSFSSRKSDSLSTAQSSSKSSSTIQDRLNQSSRILSNIYPLPNPALTSTTTSGDPGSHPTTSSYELRAKALEIENMALRNKLSREAQLNQILGKAHKYSTELLDDSEGGISDANIVKSKEADGLNAVKVSKILHSADACLKTIRELQTIDPPELAQSPSGIIIDGLKMLTTKEIKKLKSVILTFQKSYSTQTAQIEGLTKSCTVLTTQVQTNKEDIQRKSVIIQELRQQKSSDTSELERLKSSLQEKEDLCKRLQRSLTNKEALLQEAKTKLMTAEQELTTWRDKENIVRNDNIMLTTRQDNGSATTAWMTKNNTATGEISMDALLSKLSTTESDRDRLKQRVESLKSKLNDIQIELQSKTLDIDKLTKRLEQLEGIKVAYDRKDSMYQSMKDQVEKYKVEYESMKSSIDKEKEDAEKKVKTLQRHLTHQTAATEKLNNDMSTIQIQIESILSERDKYAMKARLAYTEMKKLKKAYQSSLPGSVYSHYEDYIDQNIESYDEFDEMVEKDYTNTVPVSSSILSQAVNQYVQTGKSQEVRIQESKPKSVLRMSSAQAISRTVSAPTTSTFDRLAKPKAVAQDSTTAPHRSVSKSVTMPNPKPIITKTNNERIKTSMTGAFINSLSMPSSPTHSVPPLDLSPSALYTSTVTRTTPVCNTSAEMPAPQTLFTSGQQGGNELNKTNVSEVQSILRELGL